MVFCNLVRAVLQRNVAQAGLKVLIGQLGIDGDHVRQGAHRHAVLVGQLLAIQLLGGGPVAERLELKDPQDVGAQRAHKMSDVGIEPVDCRRDQDHGRDADRGCREWSGRSAACSCAAYPAPASRILWIDRVSLHAFSSQLRSQRCNRDRAAPPCAPDKRQRTIPPQWPQTTPPGWTRAPPRRESRSPESSPSPRRCPAITPMTPPDSASNADSIRNCSRISCRVAPSALRTPISRVRSVTETSMMFMITMPPITSEMRAMATTTAPKLFRILPEQILKRRAGIDGESVRIDLGARWRRARIIVRSSS